MIILSKDRVNLESSEKRLITYNRSSVKITFRLLIRNFGGQKTALLYIQGLNENTCQLRILYPPKLSIRNDVEIFPDKQMLKELMTTRLVLQEILK